ncbi:hypothetical protein BCR44DRAFT_1433206, partial [Catenaria anguillulae PL171]
MQSSPVFFVSLVVNLVVSQHTFRPAGPLLIMSNACYGFQTLLPSVTRAFSTLTLSSGNFLHYLTSRFLDRSQSSRCRCIVFCPHWEADIPLHGGFPCQI